MNVSLSPSQKSWLKRAAADSGCASPAEYLRRLVDEQRKLASLDDVGIPDFERKLLARAKGPKRVWTDTDWTRLRRDVQQAAARRAPRRKSA